MILNDNYVCRIYRIYPKTKEFILEAICERNGKVKYIRVNQKKIKRLNLLFTSKNTYIYYSKNTYRVMIPKIFTKKEIQLKLKYLNQFLDE